MNIETLNSVCVGDIPQIVRNQMKDKIANKDEYRDAMRLKLAINDFLWAYLPMKTTLRKAEIIACKIFGLIRENSD